YIDDDLPVLQKVARVVNIILIGCAFTALVLRNRHTKASGSAVRYMTVLFILYCMT
ncbi:hypothetical protein KIPB_013570, partial [Kipferlia bialata]